MRDLDFRGRGRSGGASGAGGDPESADVDAALRQAALGRHRPDAVVSVSAVSRWYERDTRPMRRVHWLLETSAGRALGSRVVRLRLDEPRPAPPPAPLQVVSRIAPTRLPLVHGDRDAYFPLEHLRTLAQAAGPSATAWVVPGFGHAESGVTARRADRGAGRLPRSVRTRAERIVTPGRRIDSTPGGGHVADAELATGGTTGAVPWAQHIAPALVSVVAIGLLAAAAGAGGAAFAGAVALVQLALVAAWVVGVGGSLATAVIGIAAAAGADLAFLLPDRPDLGGLLAVLGLAFLAVVLGQMLRRDRQHTVAALAGGVLLVCLVSALAALLAVARSDPGAGLARVALLAVGATLVVGHVVDLVLPRPQLAPGAPRGLLGLVLSVAAGTAVAWLRRDAADLADGLSAVILGAVLGMVAALVAIAGSYVVVEAAPAGRGRAAALPVVQALLPVAACAPVLLGLQTAL